MDAAAAGTVAQLSLVPPPESPPEVRWFAPWSCVVARESIRQVWIGGTLIGQYDEDDRDRGPRNVLMVTLARDPSMHLERLAAAFGVTDEYLRLLRRRAEVEGLGAVLLERMGGHTKVSAEKRKQLWSWFDEGLTPTQAFRRQPRRGRGRLSRATMSRERARWRAEKDAAETAATVAVAIAAPMMPAAVAPVAVAPPQLRLFPSPAEMTQPERHEEEASAVSAGGADDDWAADRATAEPGRGTSRANDGADDDDGADDEQGPIVPMRSAPVQGGRAVQHIGTWLMMALAKRDGLYDALADCGAGGDAARIATDATIAALAIGERCVEGVRRLQTPTATTLLRAHRTPTASAVRRRLWKVGEQCGADLAAAMSERYMAAARGEADAPAVFYVDNHLRPYTGQEVVRKGWRMQDRRVLPGTSDYYVHDEDGRPVFRVDVPSHDSLSKWLGPIGARLRAGLGPDERILLAFDRGGAYAEQLVALRDADFEFVTYERRPFPLLADRAFDRVIPIRGEDYGAYEGRLKNLGAGRGRLRRIALRTPEGAQINLLANSRQPLEHLVAILVGAEAEDEPSGRWQQENALKHGVERWGINQLDGRRVDHYPPDTIIPNPARRRLDRALRLARTEEGDARCALAQLAEDSPRRDRLERELVDAVRRRVEIELLRPLVPKHAALADTELAGKLVHHTGELKTVVDTIRIVCANAETDLAAALAPHLRRPAEAKKLVANLLAAPGRVTVAADAIHVRLAPAANRSERVALGRLLAEVNRWHLRLPGDRRRRRLRFGVQAS
jgi:hypothetical protein